MDRLVGDQRRLTGSSGASEACSRRGAVYTNPPSPYFTTMHFYHVGGEQYLIEPRDNTAWLTVLVPAYPGCPGVKAVK